MIARLLATYRRTFSPVEPVAAPVASPVLPCGSARRGPAFDDVVTGALLFFLAALPLYVWR